MHSEDSLPRKVGSEFETMSERIDRIAGSLKQERWLPVSFRWVMARRLPLLKKLAAHSEQDWRGKLAKQVFALALASWIFGLSPLESQTVLELQTLDLELTAASPGEDDAKKAPTRSKTKED